MSLSSIKLEISRQVTCIAQCCIHRVKNQAYKLLNHVNHVTDGIGPINDMVHMIQ